MFRIVVCTIEEPFVSVIASLESSVGASSPASVSRPLGPVELVAFLRDCFYEVGRMQKEVSC